MRGNAVIERGIVNLLPCAGITLIRFFGFDLRSFSACADEEHPGNLGLLFPGRCKVKDSIFSGCCNIFFRRDVS
jgi:hypothetical protein